MGVEITRRCHFFTFKENLQTPSALECTWKWKDSGIAASGVFSTPRAPKARGKGVLHHDPRRPGILSHASRTTSAGATGPTGSGPSSRSVLAPFQIESGVASSLAEEGPEPRMRGGGGSFARGDVVDGDLKFPVGVDGGEGGEGDDDADGGALEVEGRSGFGRGRKAVAGLDGKVAGDDALADDVPDAGRREAVACRRFASVVLRFLPASKRVVAAHNLAFAFAEIDQLIEVGVHVVENVFALDPFGGQVVSSSTAALEIAISLRWLRLSGDIGIEEYAGIGRRRVHVAGRGGPLALLQPAHLQLELDLTFLQSDLLQLQLNRLLILCRLGFHLRSSQGWVRRLWGLLLEGLSQLLFGALGGGLHGRVWRLIWHGWHRRRVVLLLVRHQAVVGQRGARKAPAGAGTALPAVDLVALALEYAADGAGADDDLVRVVQPPEHVVDRHVRLSSHMVKESLSILQLKLPTADGAVADAGLLFDALLIAAGLEQATNMTDTERDKMGMDVDECKNDGSRLAKLKHQHRQHRQHRQHQRTSAVSTCLALPGLRERGADVQAIASSSIECGGCA
ncbi:hypothetical protein KC323_g303 [Hortaea werneckii]|nr:hypothetical protein KC323_g303 [Hortaea werneckii]